MFGFIRKKTREAEEIKLAIASSKEILEKIQTDKISLEIELKNIKEEMNSLAVQTDVMQQKCKEYVNSKNKIEEELKILTADKLELLKEGERIRANNEDLSFIKRKLEEEVTTLQETKQEVRNQESQLQSVIATLKSHLKDLEESKIEKEKENVALDHVQKKLQEEIEKLRNNKICLGEEYQSFEEKIADSQEKVDSLESQTKELNDIIEASQEKSGYLQEQQDKLTEEIRSLEACKSQLENENSSLEEKIADSQEKVDSLESQTKELNVIIEASQEKSRVLQEQQDKLTEGIRSLEACKSQLENENSYLEEKIANSQEKVGSLENQTKELNVIIEASQEKSRVLQEQQDKLTEGIRSLEACKSQLENENSYLEEKIANSQEKVGSLENQTKELNDIIEVSQEKSGYLQEQQDKLTEEIKNLEAYKLKLENENNSLTNHHLKDEIDASQDEVSVTVIGETREDKGVIEETEEATDPLLEALLNNIFGSEEADEPQTVVEEASETEAENETGLATQVVSNKASIIVELREKTLDEIETALENYFREIDLVGDIYLTREDYNTLKEQLAEAVKDLSETSLKIRYSNCIVLFMVYTAVYYYDNSYWEYVEESFEGIPRTKLMEIFMGVLRRFELPQFGEYANALKNVTPILCHSGIPHKSMQGLLQVIEELGSKGEGALIGKEAFKELLSEKIDKPVIRYIDYLEDRWETFLLECEEAVQSDTVKEYETLMPHMAYFIFAWQANDETISKGKRTKIVMPRICIEPDGIGVYLLLPEQKFYEEKVEEVRWDIVSEKVEEKAVESTLHYNGNYYFTKEMKLPIRETSKIIVNLVLNQEQYRRWQINHLDEEFIAFNEEGELVGKEVVGQKEHIILLKKPYSLKNPSMIIESLDELLLWQNYKGYRVNVHEIACITYGKIGYAEEKIQVKKDSRPLLFGGGYLFGKESIQTVANYIKLPEIIICDMLPRNEWNRLRIVIQGEAFTKECTLASIKEKISLRESAISIALGGEGLIPEKCFGHYDVKLYKDTSIIGKVQFAYVPHIQAAKHLNQKGIYYQFTMPRSCKLNFEDGQLVSEKDRGSDYRIELWKFTDVGQSVEGKLTYTSNTGNVIDFRIDKQVRTISWGILQLSNLNAFKWSNKLATVSLENLKNQNDYYLVVEGEEILKSQSISLILEDHQKQILKCINGLRCKEKATRMRIHLAEFIEVLSGKNADDCVLKLICKYDLYENEYRIICFQEKLVLKNLKCIIKKETMSFRWEQEGGLNQREFLIYPIDRPWEDVIIKSIPDGKSELSIDKNELCEGRYGILVRYEKDEWGFEEEDKDYQLGKLPILTLGHGITYEPMDKVELYLHQMITSSSKMVSQSLSPKVIEKQDLNKLLKTLIIIGENLENYKKGTLEKVIEAVESIIVYHLEEYFKFMLEAQLPRERFTYYCQAFNVYNHLMIKGIDLSTAQLQQLWKVSPMLGMLVSLQMKEIDREYAMDKIFSYVGRQGIKNLIAKAYDASDCNQEESVDRQQHPLEDCLKLSLWQDCYCKSIKPALSQAIIGDKEELREYFSHAASTWEVAYRKKRRAAMQSQQILTQNQKSIFMGKTYLEVVMEMRNQNASYIKQVSDKVHKILGIRRTAIKEFMQTDKHKKVLNLLTKRIDEGQYAEYWCGIIAYLQACESLGIKENIFTPYQSQQLTQLLIEQMNALYERDRIVFQIYLLMEG